MKKAAAFCLEEAQNMERTSPLIHPFSFLSALAKTFYERDVILIDIRMPRCDCLTLTRLIKAEMLGVNSMLTNSTDDDGLFEAIAPAPLSCWSDGIDDCKPTK